LLKASQDIVSRSGDFLAMPGSHIDPTAVVSGGSCIGTNTSVGAGAVVDGSIIEAGCVIGDQAQISNSFIASGTRIQKGEQIASSFAANEEILPIA
jgi:NDP-sugar pyrophosphorylase family protein